MGPSFEWQGHGQQGIIVIVLHSAAVESMEDEKFYKFLFAIHISAVRWGWVIRLLLSLFSLAVH